MQLFKKMLLVISMCCCLSVSTAYAETEKTDTSSIDTTDTKDTTSVEIQTPASVTGEVIQGQGTVIDFSTTGSKAFYTIRDQDQKIFHLIIDLQKTENNVYFLSDVNKSQMEGSEEPTENVQTAPVPPIEPEKEEQSESGNGSFLLMVLLVAVIIVVVYYFRMTKKKKEQGNAADEDEMNEDYEEDDMLYEEDNMDNKDYKDNK